MTFDLVCRESTYYHLLTKRWALKKARRNYCGMWADSNSICVSLIAFIEFEIEEKFNAALKICRASLRYQLCSHNSRHFIIQADKMKNFCGETETWNKWDIIQFRLSLKDQLRFSRNLHTIDAMRASLIILRLLWIILDFFCVLRSAWKYLLYVDEELRFLYNLMQLK